MLWHLLSLDAPTVAAVWTVFVSWSAGVRPHAVDVAAMFLAVWMLYAADRLLDAKPLFTSASAPDLEERHRFHHRHRRGFLSIILLSGLPLGILLHDTADTVLHFYTLLAAMLGLWLLVVHARPAPSALSHRLPKELAVGLFFPAAVFLPTVARVPACGMLLAAEAVFFGLLCTLNCLFLFAWEHPAHQGHANVTTRWAVRHIGFFALTATVLPAALLLLGAALPTPASVALPPVFLHPSLALLAISLSAALLLMLHAARFRLQPLTLRALADLALLTPIPISLAVVAQHGRP